MSDLSTNIFIETLQELHKKIDAGFKDTSRKIDMVNLSASQRYSNCGARFNSIEKKMAYQIGAGKIDIQKKGTIEYIKRGLLLFLAIGTLTVGYKVFVILMAVNKLLPAIKHLPQ